MDSWSMAAEIAGVFLLAGFVKGLIGLGLPTVAIGLLVLAMPPAQAAAIIVVPSLTTNVWQAGAGRALLPLLRRLWPLLAGICAGTCLGVLLLPGAMGNEAILWLGIALAAYALLGLLRVHFSVPKRGELWLSALVGVATGVITVATGVFTLPAVPFIQALHLDRDRLVQALGLSFTVSTVMLAAALSHAGGIGWSLAMPALVALACSIVGMLWGQAARGRVAPETFRLAFLLGLLALGVHLAVRGLL
jgi:uncharacterized membrane protein YfcA